MNIGAEQVEGQIKDMPDYKTTTNKIVPLTLKPFSEPIVLTTLATTAVDRQSASSRE